VGVGGAGRHLDALSSQVLGAGDADAGLEGSIVAFVGVALGDGGAEDAESVDVPDVADVALTGNPVEGLVGTALSAGSEDPEVPIIAVALSVLEVAVDSTILVVGALAADDLIAIIADAAAGFMVRVSVEGAEERGDALSVPEGESVVALALSVDVGLVCGADGVAEAVQFEVARFAEALVRVRVVVVAGVAVGADSSDADVLRFADAGFGDG